MGPEGIFPYASLPKLPVACPVCDTVNPHVWTQDRYGFDVPLATCRTCTLIYLAEQLTRDGYDRLYGGAYRRLVWRYMYGDRPFVDQLLPMSRELAVTYLSFIVPRVKGRIASVLDAGGSDGGLGRAITGVIGGTLTILDPSSTELPEGGIRGYLEDAPLGTYDVALCLETVDHLTNPIAALHNLRRATSRLFLDYIDVDRFRQRFSRAIPWKIDHPLYWTKQAMATALERSGWTRTGYKRPLLRHTGIPRDDRVLIAAQ